MQRDGRGGSRDGKCAQKTVFSEIYIVYMWLKKVILVADNTILGIHKIDKWIPLYRLVDSAISICRFRYIDLSIFCDAQARNKNPLNTVVPYPLRRAFHRYGTTVPTVMEHSCSKGIQLSVKGLRSLKGLKGLYIFCTSASFVMVSVCLRDDFETFVKILGHKKL